MRYVLEGSVRRSGNQVRVNAQLIDAETDAHLWAERFDRDTGDLFALQNEITSRIAVALNLELIGAEAARPTEHPDALDYILRGRAALSKPPTRDNYAEAISLFERALALDPRSVEAQSWLASALAGRVLDEMTDSRRGRHRTRGRAGRASLGGIAPQPACAFRQRPGAARAGPIRGGHSRIRDGARVQSQLGGRICRISASASSSPGRWRRRSRSQEQAIRLSPRDPEIGIWYCRIGQVHLLQSRIDEAILWLEKARSANPALPAPHAWLASAYALKGETERAAAELAEARRLSGDDRYSSIARLKAARIFRGAEDPRLVRSHLFRRSAQGRDAGGMTAARFAGNALGIFVSTPRRGR